MKRKRVKVNKNSKVRRQTDPIPWKYCVLTVICGLLLVSGFFVAAEQHFSAIGVAMDNAKLRKRIAKLNDEQRRLTISKERAANPYRIAKLAKSIGFTAAPRTVLSSSSDYEHVSARESDMKPVFSYASNETKGPVKKPVPVGTKAVAIAEPTKEKSRNPADELFIQDQIAALTAKETTAGLRK